MTFLAAPADTANNCPHTQDQPTSGSSCEPSPNLLGEMQTTPTTPTQPPKPPAGDRGGPCMKTTIIKVPPFTLDLLDLPDGTTLVRVYFEADETRPLELVDEVVLARTPSRPDAATQ